MRIRKKKWAAPELSVCDFFVKNPEENAGKWRDAFKKNQPLCLEIGCGKGQFAEEIAKRNPNINYIAVEQNVNVLVTAMERTRDSGTPNLKYLMGMAEYLEKVFPKGSVQCIYLNFSCPFPKNAYAKHRLTHQRFLDIYRNILADDGVIYQKTDNAPFFEFSLNSYCDNGFKMRNITFDLHNSKIEGNIITEYEAKFSSMGFPIYYVEAFPQKN